MDKPVKDLLSDKIAEVGTSMSSWALCASSNKDKSDQYTLEECRKLASLKEVYKILELVGDTPLYQVRQTLSI